MTFQCLHHNIETPVCALENVMILSDWLRENNEHCRGTEIFADNPASWSVNRHEFASDQLPKLSRP